MGAKNCSGSCKDDCKPKLYYFDVKGRGEAIRLAFAIAGKEFEDVRLTHEQFYKLKSDKPYLFPNGQVPSLECGDKVLCQSQAIIDMVFTMSGMNVTDVWEVAKAKESMGCVEDIFNAIVPSFYESNDEVKKQMRKKLNDETLPNKFKSLNALIEQNGNSGYMSNGQLCPCDLVLYTLVDWIKQTGSDGLDGVDGNKIIQHLHSVKKCYDTVHTNPKVMEWNQKNNKK
eukprot:GHVR01013193.1.p1 GENE.GHVR01013193.1~~GHVR01013193.1.p1  ORF type:complete len:228 (+),score=41.19 GHVR01013193.1:33-716(+)